MRAWLGTVTVVLLSSLLGTPAAALACGAWCLDAAGGSGQGVHAHAAAPPGPAARHAAHADGPMAADHQHGDLPRPHDQHGPLAPQGLTADTASTVDGQPGSRASAGLRAGMQHCSLSSDHGPAVRQVPRATIEHAAAAADGPVSLLPYTPPAYVASAARADRSPPPLVYRAPPVLRI